MIGQKDGADGRNTTKAQNANSMAITEVIYWRRVHFLISLNSGGNSCSILCLFFNEHELCKTARNTSHKIRMSPVR